MKVIITGRHMELTLNLREYAEKKIKKLDKYFHWLSDIHVIMYIEKFDHVAEAVVNCNGARFYAIERATDMYSSIDLLVHKIEKQIVKYKEKHSDHKAISLGEMCNQVIESDSH